MGAGAATETCGDGAGAAVAAILNDEGATGAGLLAAATAAATAGFGGGAVTAKSSGSADSRSSTRSERTSSLSVVAAATLVTPGSGSRVLSGTTAAIGCDSAGGSTISTSSQPIASSDGAANSGSLAVAGRGTT